MGVIAPVSAFQSSGLRPVTRKEQTRRQGDSSGEATKYQSAEASRRWMYVTFGLLQEKSGTRAFKNAGASSNARMAAPAARRRARSFTPSSGSPKNFSGRIRKE